MSMVIGIVIHYTKFVSEEQKTCNHLVLIACQHLGLKFSDIYMWKLLYR